MAGVEYSFRLAPELVLLIAYRSYKLGKTMKQHNFILAARQNHETFYSVDDNLAIRVTSSNDRN